MLKLFNIKEGLFESYFELFVKKDLNMKLSKCDSTYALTWSKKISMIDLLGGKCSACGIKNIFVLEFHHSEDNKEKGINAIKGLRLSSIRNEVLKCVLLCKNCHSERHYDDGGIDRRRSILKQKMLEYKNIFCCEKCGYQGKNYRSLEFHHKVKESKSFEINSEVWKIKRIKKFGIEEKIMIELDKCEIVCRNCHGILHTRVEKFNNLKEEIYKKVISYREYDVISKDIVLELHNRGLKNIDIARQLNCAKSSITYLLQRYCM